MGDKVLTTLLIVLVSLTTILIFGKITSDTFTKIIYIDKNGLRELELKIDAIINSSEFVYLSVDITGEIEADDQKKDTVAISENLVRLLNIRYGDSLYINQIGFLKYRGEIIRLYKDRIKVYKEEKILYDRINNTVKFCLIRGG